MTSTPPCPMDDQGQCTGCTYHDAPECPACGSRWAHRPGCTRFSTAFGGYSTAESYHQRAQDRSDNYEEDHPEQEF